MWWTSLRPCNVLYVWTDHVCCLLLLGHDTIQGSGNTNRREVVRIVRIDFQAHVITDTWGREVSQSEPGSYVVCDCCGRSLAELGAVVDM